MFKARLHYIRYNPVFSLVVISLVPLILLAIFIFLELKLPSSDWPVISFSDRMATCGVIASVAIPLAIMVTERLTFYEDRISTNAVLGFTKAITLFTLIIENLLLFIVYDNKIFIAFSSIFMIGATIFSYTRIISLFADPTSFTEYRRRVIGSTLFKFITGHKHQDNLLASIEDFISHRAEDAKNAVKNNNLTELREALAEIQHLLEEYSRLVRKHSPQIKTERVGNIDSKKYQIDLIIIGVMSSIATELECSASQTAELILAIHDSMQAIAQTAVNLKDATLLLLFCDESIRIYQIAMKKNASATGGKPISRLSLHLAGRSIKQAEVLKSQIIAKRGKDTVELELLLCHEIFRELFILIKYRRFKDAATILEITLKLVKNKTIPQTIINTIILELAIILAFVDTTHMSNDDKAIYKQTLNAIFMHIDINKLEEYISTNDEDCHIVIDSALEFIKIANNETVEDIENLATPQDMQKIKEFLREFRET